MSGGPTDAVCVSVSALRPARAETRQLPRRCASSISQPRRASRRRLSAPAADPRASARWRPRRASPRLRSVREQQEARLSSANIGELRTQRGIAHEVVRLVDNHYILYDFSDGRARAAPVDPTRRGPSSKGATNTWTRLTTRSADFRDAATSHLQTKSASAIRATNSTTLAPPQAPRARAGSRGTSCPRPRATVARRHLRLAALELRAGVNFPEPHHDPRVAPRKAARSTLIFVSTPLTMGRTCRLVESRWT